ncbi:very short patch repair endonuclease [Rhizorhapis suberifaciens]|uniref:very short patch repair endonuclease n=1 Tax=Rhizorhapis suberifaciens TaxID=13656 RepID=UPI0024838C46|nr:very short patch repair endonuclease [Rhizorhapis suberifaciens]
MTTDPPVSPQRSALMSRVGPKDTKPEMLVRRTLHRLGYRFRLHQADLHGRPDIVLPRYRTVIFVHGCFWHRHPGCSKASTPKTREDFWQDKFATNIARDRRNEDALRADGWQVLVVWECETRNPVKLDSKVLVALAPSTTGNCQTE